MADTFLNTLDVRGKTAASPALHPEVVTTPPTWRYAGGGCS